MRRERIKYNWTTIARTYFKEGYIDQWMGDQADHPENEKQSSICLNAFSTLYRLNNGDWYSLHYQSKAHKALQKNHLTAREAWGSVLIPYCDLQRHLVCMPYSEENLHIMAEHLKIKRCWFHKKGNRSHYDIPKKRIEEIMEKCAVVSTRTIVEITRSYPQ